MKLVKLSNVAKRLEVSVPTLRKWIDFEGVPYEATPGGHLRIKEEDISKLLKYSTYNTKPKISIGYCRVSSPSQKDDLERQIENVRTYLISKGFSFEIISDIGSGINFNKPGLLKLMSKIKSKEVDRIVVLYKDRMMRFAFELFENWCKLFGVEIEIIDNTERSKQEELVDDLIQVITVFSARLQGERSHKTKKLISDLKNEK